MTMEGSRKDAVTFRDSHDEVRVVDAFRNEAEGRGLRCEVFLEEDSRKARWTLAGDYVSVHVPGVLSEAPDDILSMFVSAMLDIIQGKARGFPQEVRAWTKAAIAGPKVHELKIAPRWFDAVLDGSKTFEIRNDDRGFRVGDGLRLREYDRDRTVDIEAESERPIRILDGYTGRECRATVLSVLRYEDFPMGLQPGYAILSIAKVVP